MEKDKNKTKVAVGMSGGVDSSVAAALLKKQGYDVVGIFLRFWSDPTFDGESKVSNKCCSVESMNDARRVAHLLGIELITINMSARFKEFIVDNFLEEYEAGATPNPCVRCNQFVKTGYFLEKARELGFEYVATGHYIRRRENADGSVDMLLPKDLKKDQTYFMHRIDQDTAAHTLFPLGDLTKDEVRALAKDFGLPTYKKSDSQEICFVADQGHNNFLKRWVRMEKGDIVDTEGTVLGSHEGLPLYTFGQRKGLEIGGPGGPYYVVSKNHKDNVLVVTNDETYPGLFSREARIDDMRWIHEPPKDGGEYLVKVRYMQTPVPATFSHNKIMFKDPLRAVTPGQSAVLYEDEVLIGGGIISEVS
jgi:tRNA-specific 2-thiouridylase